MPMESKDDRDEAKSAAETRTVSHKLSSFTALVQSLANGGVNADLTDDLRELLAAIQAQVDEYSTKSKGSLTFKLDFEVEPSGIVNIDHAITVQKPKIKRRRSHAWAAGDGMLSLTDPKQPDLPNLRTLAGGRESAPRTV